MHLSNMNRWCRLSCKCFRRWSSIL